MWEQAMRLSVCLKAIRMAAQQRESEDEMLAKTRAVHEALLVTRLPPAFLALCFARDAALRSLPTSAMLLQRSSQGRGKSAQCLAQPICKWQRQSRSGQRGEHGKSARGPAHGAAVLGIPHLQDLGQGHMVSDHVHGAVPGWLR